MCLETRLEIVPFFCKWVVKPRDITFIITLSRTTETSSSADNGFRVGFLQKKCADEGSLASEDVFHASLDDLIQTYLFSDSLVLSWKYGNKEMSREGC